MYQQVVTSMADSATIAGQPVQIVTAAPQQTVQVTNGSGAQVVQTANGSGQSLETSIGDASTASLAGQQVQIVTAGPDQTVQVTNDGQTIALKQEQIQQSNIVPSATQAVEVVAMETQPAQAQSQTQQQTQVASS